MTAGSHLPYSKYSVYQKASKEAKNHVGPGIPGIERHELRRVHLHILQEQEENLKIIK